MRFLAQMIEILRGTQMAIKFLPLAIFLAINLHMGNNETNAVANCPTATSTCSDCSHCVEALVNDGYEEVVAIRRCILSLECDCSPCIKQNKSPSQPRSN